MSANADQLVAGLDKSAQKVDSWSKKVSGTAAKIGKGVGSGAEAVGSKLGVGALAAVGIGGGIVGVGMELGEKLVRSVAQIDELNRAMAESARLADLMAEAVVRAGDATLKLAAGGAPGVNLTAGLAKAEDHLHQMEREKEALKVRLDSLTDTSQQVKQILPVLERMFPKTFNAGSETHFGAISETEGQLGAIQKRLDAAAQSVKQFKDALKEPTANELGKALMVDDRKRLEAASKSIDDLTKSLREQAATFGMSAGQAAVWKAQTENLVRPEQLDALKVAAAEMDRLTARAENVKRAFRAAFNSDKLPTERKLGAAMESGSAAAFSTIVRHQVAGMDGGKSQTDRIVAASDRVERVLKDMTKLIDERLKFDIIGL